MRSSVFRKRDVRIKQLEMKDKQREIFVKRTTEEMNRLRRQQRTAPVSFSHFFVHDKIDYVSLNRFFLRPLLAPLPLLPPPLRRTASACGEFS